MAEQRSYGEKARGVLREALTHRDPAAFFRAGKGVFDRLSNGFSRRVSDMMAKPLDAQGTPSRVLCIESVDRHDGWGIGDGALRLWTLSDMVRQLQVDIDLVTTANRVPLFNHSPLIQDVSTTVRDFSTSAYDLILSFNPSFQLELIKLYAFGDVPHLRLEMGVDDHLSEAYRLQAAEYFGYDYSDTLSPVPLQVLDDEKEHARRVLDKEPGDLMVGVIVGAKNGLKHFQEWSSVIDQLLAQYPQARVVLLGGKDAFLEAQFLGAKYAPHKVMNMVGTSLKGMMALISETSLCVGMDSGPMNIAYALGVPSVAMFSIISPDRVIPASRHLIRTLVEDCPYDPATRCHRLNGGRRCASGQTYQDHEEMPPCLQALDVAELAQTVVEMLEDATGVPVKKRGVA